MRRRSFVWLLLGTTLLLGCVDKPVRDLRSVDDTLALTDGEKRSWYQSDQLDKALHNRGLLLGDEQVDRYLQMLMDRLYPELAGVLKPRVAKSSALNAFALSNGSIYINLGLLARVRNEAQLVMILSHEAAHFVEQHSLKKRDAADGAVVAGVTFTVLTGIPFSGDLIAASAMSGYSQDFERAADELGFERLVALGYDPAEAAQVFRIMREEVDALDISQPFLYSSHPRLSERIETLQALAKKRPSSGGVKNAERLREKVGHLRGRLLAQYLQEQDFKRLILILEDKNRRRDYPADALFYLGEAYRLRGEEGDRAKALAAYRQAIDEAPDFAASYRALGLLEMKDGDTAKAKALLLKYIALAPNASDRKYMDSYLRKLESH